MTGRIYSKRLERTPPPRSSECVSALWLHGGVVSVKGVGKPFLSIIGLVQQDRMRRRTRKHRSEVDEYAGARSTKSRSSLKSQEPQHVVKTKTQNKEYMQAELETAFQGSAACKPDTTDPREFHRVLLNRHWTYRTACTAVALHTAAVAYSLQATMMFIKRLGLDYWLLLATAW